MGETGRGELQADLGKLAGVILAQALREVVLEEPDFQRTVLGVAPFLIAASGFPIGDVAFGDSDAVFFESAANLGVRDVVAEHAVDHVAFEVREVGDFAVAGARLGFGSRQDSKLRAIANRIEECGIRSLFSLELRVHDRWCVA